MMRRLLEEVRREAWSILAALQEFLGQASWEPIPVPIKVKRDEDQDATSLVRLTGT